MSPRSPLHSKSPKSTFGPPGPGRAAAVRRAEAVVRLPLLGVGEDVVRRLHLLEALLGGLVALVRVRVVLARELPVRLLDLVGRGALLDAERVVERLRHRLRAPRACRRRRGDDDPGGPHDALAELVALLHDVDHRALLGLGRLGEQRLVHVRVELPVRLDRRRRRDARAAPRASGGRGARLPRAAPPRAARPPTSARSRSSRIGISSAISRSFASWTYSCRSRAARFL